MWRFLLKLYFYKSAEISPPKIEKCSTHQLKMLWTTEFSYDSICLPLFGTHRSSSVHWYIKLDNQIQNKVSMAVSLRLPKISMVLTLFQTVAQTVGCG